LVTLSDFWTTRVSPKVAQGRPKGATRAPGRHPGTTKIHLKSTPSPLEVARAALTASGGTPWTKNRPQNVEIDLFRCTGLVENWRWRRPSKQWKLYLMPPGLARKGVIVTPSKRFCYSKLRGCMQVQFILSHFVRSPWVCHLNKFRIKEAQA